MVATRVNTVEGELSLVCVGALGPGRGILVQEPIFSFFFFKGRLGSYSVPAVGSFLA